MGNKPGWKQRYDTLKGFIASNPGISINAWETSIPSHLRDRFYSQFDDVRRAFIESCKSPFYSDVCALGKAYAEAEELLFTRLALSKHIELPVDLSSLLYTPQEGLMRLIYDPLFELVQEKITETDFEMAAQKSLEANAPQMYMLGYQLWAAVSIMLLLEPDSIHRVSLDHEGKPFLEALDSIVIGSQHHHPSKRIPEIVLHSKRLNIHVAFKMPVTREVDSYILPVELPTQKMLRERTGDTSSALSDRMIFISAVPDLERIPVFADLHERRIFSPDLTIDFLTRHDLSDSTATGRVQSRIEIMKPRLGGHLVVINPKAGSKEYETEHKITACLAGLE